MRFTNDVSSSIFFFSPFSKTKFILPLDDVSLRKESAAHLFYYLTRLSLFLFFGGGAAYNILHTYAIFFVFARKNEGRRHFWSPTA